MAEPLYDVGLLMHIVVEPGSYTLENMGDVAMLQVAARRLRQQWPDATINVVTEAPQRLMTLCPGATPLPTRELSHATTPAAARTTPRLLSWGVLQRLGIGKTVTTEPSLPDTFADTIRAADLLVVSGMGGLNDAFAARASRLLGTLELAGQCGVPVALLGQGVGPAREPVLRDRLARVLAQADLIALRERRSGPGLLAELGVSRDSVVITGDDAVELAYEARPERSGTALGINVRVAEYAGVGETAVSALRAVLREAAGKLRTRVLPIPISHRHGGLDVRTNRVLLEDIDPSSDGGATLFTPLDVIQQVGRCRVVVTGSYHGGVFALAQGIPVVALVNSEYYADKFLGLADMFGTGCEIVRLADPAFPHALAEAIDRGWASAEHVRARLLAAAAQQVDSGYDAYRYLHALVGDAIRHVRRQTQPVN